MPKILILATTDVNFYNLRRELIITLQNNGYEIVLCGIYGDKIGWFIRGGCRFIGIAMDRRGKNICHELKLLKDYSKIFREEKPAIVLTFATKPSIYGGFICSQLGIPYIVNNAGLLDTKGAFDKFIKVLCWVAWRKSSCMMFQNSREREVIKDLLPCSIHYRDIPGSGVNLIAFPFCNYPRNDDVIEFNFVARIMKDKGIEEFLECAKIIKRKYTNTRFVIYGGYEEECYKSKVVDLEQMGIVEYKGVQSDMSPCIKIAHALINPSYHEGMSNVVLEYSAMGRVCLGADVNGIREAIADGVTGFLFQPRNVTAMVEVVEKFILLSHDKKVIMGRKAREKMERDFDRQIVVNTYLEEIKRIVKRDSLNV